MQDDECFVPRLLRWAKEHEESKLAFAYLNEKGGIANRVTYRQLVRQSSAVAQCMLNEYGLKPGDRVLLVYPPSLDFIVTFIACLICGVIAVPAFPPNPTKLQKELATFRSIISSSGARIALTSAQYYSAVKMAELKHFVTGEESAWGQLKSWVTTDEAIAAASDNTSLDSFPSSFPEVNKSDIAFLQYTSGSTSDPKGVMISQGNLAHNLTLIITGLQAVDNTVVVSWLPQYHDMGLIGSFLGAVYCGGCGYYLSPLHFIKNPVLWVQCMSTYQATHIQAPNFAYTLTARKFLNSSRSSTSTTLDLSSVRHMINAAEPVEASSIDSFYAVFEQYGLRRGVIFPTYGLAEHTVYVCSNGSQRITVKKSDMEIKRQITVLDNSILLSKDPKQVQDAVSLVGCGKPLESRGVDLKIVHCIDSTGSAPASFDSLGEGLVGEIWIRSPSKALGYWGLQDKSKTDFGAMLSCDKVDSKASDSCMNAASVTDDKATAEEELLLSTCDVERGFLRTGDLGFLLNGELFVCGRMKDLIIIRGRNVYPQDIERTCEQCSAEEKVGNVDGKVANSISKGTAVVGAADLKALRAGCSAAFSVPICGEEVLVYTAEVSDDFNAQLSSYSQRAKDDACNALIHNLRYEVRTQHGVSPSVVLLLQPRSIPKTTSGKIARQWVRRAYLDEELKRVAAWSDLDAVVDDEEKDADATRLVAARDSSAIDSSAVENLSVVAGGVTNKLGLPLGQIDPTLLTVDEVLWELKRLVGVVIAEKNLANIKETLPVSAVGLDSMQGIALQSAFEERFTVQIPDEVLMDSDSTLLTLANSLVGGGSFKHRPVMVQAIDVHNAVMRIEARKPRAAWFSGARNKNQQQQSSMGSKTGAKSELMTPQWFAEHGVKAHVDTLSFANGSALKPTGPPLSPLEDFLCCLMGFGIFGSFFWFPLLLVLCFIVLPLHAAVAATLGAFAFIYLLPWDCWPPGGRKSWTYGLGCRYYSYRSIIEAPFENYTGITSIYAFGPHGVFPIAPGFHTLLNGFVVGENFHMLAASAVFWTPVFNIFARFWGNKSVERKEFQRLLDMQHSVGLLPGGIAEMFVASKEKETMVVQNRKGFINLALQSGTQIVPCYCFGNAQLYDNTDSKLLESASRFLRTSIIFFWGRFGLPIPKRHPILVVIGKPIPLPKVASPTPELINEYHEKYLRETRRVFDKYKNTMMWQDKKLEFKR